MDRNAFGICLYTLASSVFCGNIRELETNKQKKRVYESGSVMAKSNSVEYD